MAREVVSRRRSGTESSGPELIEMARASVETRLKAILDQPYSKENMYGGSRLRTYRKSCRWRGAEPRAERRFRRPIAAEKAIVRDRSVRRQTSRQPQHQRDSRNHLRGGYQPACARLRPVHPRRDPGAHPGDPGHAQGSQELDNLVETRSSATCTTTTSRPAAHRRSETPRRASAVKSGTELWRDSALVPVIPDEKSFPYTLRLVSEVLASVFVFDSVRMRFTLAPMDTGAD